MVWPSSEAPRSASPGRRPPTLPVLGSVDSGPLWALGQLPSEESKRAFAARRHFLMAYRIDQLLRL